MQYVIKTFDRAGSMYRSPIPFEDQEEARAAFDAQQLSGRFVRAELWSGTSESMSDWTDGERLGVKP